MIDYRSINRLDLIVIQIIFEFEFIYIQILIDLYLILMNKHCASREITITSTSSNIKTNSINRNIFINKDTHKLLDNLYQNW